jgi:hypothetical protein
MDAIQQSELACGSNCCETKEQTMTKGGQTVDLLVQIKIYKREQRALFKQLNKMAKQYRMGDPEQDMGLKSLFSSGDTDE